MGYGMYGGAVAVKNPVLPWVEYMYVDNYYVKILTENGVVGVTAFGMMLARPHRQRPARLCAHGKDPLVTPVRRYAVRPRRCAPPQRV